LEEQAEEALMAYTIQTVKAHRDALKREAENAKRRLDLDVSDAGLSSWAGDAMTMFHHAALEALALGKKHGIRGPAVEVPVLVDAAGQLVDARLRQGDFGLYWHLGKDAEQRFGKRFVPHGGTSRVQRQLGLREARRVVPASRSVQARTAGRGSPVFFTVIPA
jgi:hypothetical protein